jgi:endogenous inhibitor of DNA gyrase (YacG/DUF329 family)
MFTVEIRTNCKICNTPLDAKKRQRTYCSKQCRTKGQWIDLKAKETPERREKRLSYGRAKYSRYAKGKIRCRLCDKWFIKPLAHTWQVHKLGQNEYKEIFDLPLKRGIIPECHRKILSQNVWENGTIENLKKGVARRFIKGDPRAKIVTGWKGRNGSKGFIEY